MTTDNNFAGRDGHVTFVGVVEGRDDPAKMGRLRVRIIGLHTDDTNIVPTEDLPWAQVVAPINGARNFSLPKDGEWVHGFFQDGYNSQMPVVTGIYLGIQSEQPSVDDGSVAKIAELEKELATLNSTLLLMTATGGQSAVAARQIQQQKAKITAVQKQIDDLKQVVDSKPQRGFRDRRTPRQVAAAPNPPAGVSTERYNQPVLPALAREITANTGIEVSNNNRIHVCDVVAEMDLGIASLKSKVSGLISQIRVAIEALYDSLSLNPSSEGLKQQAEAIKSKLNNLKKELKKITDEISAVKAYIKYVEDLIDYINKLPAELQKLYAGCLSQATKDLTTYTDKLKTLETATTSTVTAAAITTATATLKVTEETTAVETKLKSLV